MINIIDILNLTKKLLPTGRAFKVSQDSNIEKLIKGLYKSEVDLANFGLSILDEILPDNANFTTDDAMAWEIKLNLKVNPPISLSQRMALILRKYQYPGIHIYRQNWRFIQQQLQDAGFMVNVFENKPLIDYWSLQIIQHNEDNQHGIQSEMGGIDTDALDMVANSKFPNEQFDFGQGNNKCVFVIAGATIGIPAQIPLSLMEEFRKLILILKPVRTIALLNIQTYNDWILRNAIWDDTGFWYDTEVWNG